MDEEEAKDASHNLDAEDDGSHADEIDDEPAEIGQADELPKPLPMFRSRSETVGATKFNVTQKASKKTDWLEVHRKWKQWNRFHKRQAAAQGEDRDLSSPFCSPLYSVLQFAKNSEIHDPSPLRQLMCEHEKRAAFRLFALKYQGKLYELLQGTPYQRFIWGNQSHSLKLSSLERVEVCGE